MDTSSAYMIGAIAGSIAVGVVVGLVPAITGAVKKKPALAVGGFFACLIAAFIMGIILAAPVCGVFMYFILRKPKNAANQQVVVQNNVVVDMQNDGQQNSNQDAV